MARIFISYSRVDTPFAAEFVDSLKVMFPTYEVWIDTELTGGDNWWLEILRQIEQCDIFIYLLSNESVTSPYCQAEFAEARRLQKRIVTVQVRDRTKLPPELSDIQYVDMKAGIDDAEAQALLVEAINKYAENLPRSRPAPLWQPRTARPGVVDEEVARPERTDVDTPPLVQPVDTPSNARGFGITVTVMIIVFVVGVVAVTQFGQTGGQGNTPTNTAESDPPTRTLPAINTPSMTPSNTTTPTFTPTATPTLTSLEAALERARTFTGSNRDWQPYGWTFPDDPVGAEMMLVPVGSFMMGSEDGDYDEKPVHLQRFTRPYWIDSTEVTRSQYGSCVTAGVCTLVSSSDSSTRNTQPINQVTWFQARSYCAWRRARLPTEVEWEYAARGLDSWIYPWSNAWNPNSAVYDANSNDETADVGSRPSGASWVGAFDLSGNVREWVSSAYRRYPYDVSDGREGNINSTGVSRVLRGGSFGYGSYNLRSTKRFWGLPNVGGSNTGFRCARNA